MYIHIILPPGEARKIFTYTYIHIIFSKYYMYIHIIFEILYMIEWVYSDTPPRRFVTLTGHIGQNWTGAVRSWTGSCDHLGQASIIGEWCNATLVILERALTTDVHLGMGQTQCPDIPHVKSCFSRFIENPSKFVVWYSMRLFRSIS